MTSSKRRVAAGRRIGGGRIRVDAARAVGKLRDHQLADPILWALEAVRAAMAAGAEAIQVDGDADEVWIAWEGEPVPERELTRLFDELVSPSGEADKRATRLLATAVNAALGLSPRWLDVYHVDAGVVRAVRYTARILMTAEDGEASALRELAATDASLPGDAPVIPRGCIVHLKRYPWLETLTLLATGQEPRELRLIRESCQDLSVPIRIGAGPLARPHAPHDVLRLGVGPPNAFIALTDPAGATSRPSLELSELGVVLMRAEFVLTGLNTAARVPLRARLDMPKLPTNASRSAVRREAAQIRDWERDAAAAVPELVRIAARELSAERTRTWDADALERLRGGCTALLAAALTQSDLWGQLAGDVPDAFAPLLDAPLLRDALGTTRTPREIGRARRQVVHYANDVLDPSLEPFFSCVLWAPPGDPARALLPARAPESTKVAIAKAKRWARAREAWLARPILGAALEPGARRLVTHPLQAPGSSAHSCVPASLFAADLELEGEVSIAPPSSARTGIHVDFLVEGRRTSSTRLDAPLDAVAIVSSPALRVEMDHETIAAGDHVARIERAVLAAAVAACEAAARTLMGRKVPSGERASIGEVDGRRPTRDELAELTRVGTALALRLLTSLPEDERPEPLLSERSALVRAAAWPRVGEPHIALSDLTRTARAQGILAHADAGFTGEGPKGRPVVVTSLQERRLLRTVTGVPSLDYTASLRRHVTEPEHFARALFGDVDHALIRTHETHRVAFAWGARRTVVRLWHMGRPMHFASAMQPDEPEDEPYAMVLDDDRLVPSSDWRTLAQPPSADQLDRRSLERDLFVALADALLGKPPPELRLRVPDAARSPETLGAFLRSAGRLDGRSLLGRARLEQLRKRAIFPVAFSASPASAQSLEDKGTLQFVPPDASSLRGAPVAGLAIATLPIEEAQGAGLLFGLTPRNANSVIRDRQRDALRDSRRATHMLQRAVDVRLGAGRHVTAIEGAYVRGQLAFEPHGVPHTRVTVLAEQRSLERIEDGDLPYLVAIVDVDPSRVSYEHCTLTDPGRAHLHGALRAAARKLIETMAKHAPASIASEPQARALVSAFLESKRHDPGRRDVKRARAALLAAPIFPTVQGGRASIVEATQGKTIRSCSATVEWIPAAPDERASALDAPILALPSTKNDPNRKLVDALAAGGPLRDYSDGVRRLLATRRVAQGLTRRPSLGQVVDARFRWKLEHLASRAASPLRELIESFGPGDLALCQEGPSQLHVFEAGSEARVMTFDLVPPIHVAAELALLDPGTTPSPKLNARLAKMMDAAASQAMREAIDLGPGALPTWFVAQLRQSALIGGAPHLEALADIPLFVTTAGEPKTPAQLREQAARFPHVWYTPEAGVHSTPLDPARFALLLSAKDAKRLEDFVPLELATEELRLDAIARLNRDRPRATELGPSRQQASWGLASGSDEREGVRVVVMPLSPACASHAQTWAHRDMRPLGGLEPSAAWPTCAWVESAKFEPDRTWSAPAAGRVVAHARALVRELSERLLEAQFEPAKTAPVASLYVDEGLCSAAFAGRRDVQVRGRLWLSDPGEEALVRLTHAGGAIRLAPQARPFDPQRTTLPLCGELLVSGAEVGALAHALSSVVRFAYERMMRELASELCRGEARDEQLWLAELLRALALDAAPELERDSDPVLPFMQPRTTYGELTRRAKSGLKVLVVTPDEHERADALQTDWPHLIDDGSLASIRAREALGRCAVVYRDELTRRVLQEESLQAIDARDAAVDAARPSTTRAQRAARKPEKTEKRDAPPPLQPAQPDGMPPEDRLQDLCQRVSRAASSGAALGHVRCEAQEERYPIATLSERGDAIVLAAEHAAIRTLTDARSRREAAVILAAQATMLLSRAAAQSPERELAAIERLLADDP